MGKTQTATQSGADKLQNIEELAKELNIPNWQLDGLMSKENWAEGKQLTKAELQQALKNWLEMPMSGRKEKDK